MFLSIVATIIVVLFIMIVDIIIVIKILVTITVSEGLNSPVGDRRHAVRNFK